MNKPLLLFFTLLGTAAMAQEHFAGINTSRRGGMLNAALNPAEYINLSTGYEVNVLNISANVANNKVTFGEILDGGSQLENKLFLGSTPVNFSADVEIQGPGFAMKLDKWAFAISSAAKVKANFIDINTNLGGSLTNSGFEALIDGRATIDTDYNQKATATSWGEIGLSAAREIYNDDKHKFSGGVTFKLLFPGSYANISADRFRGTIENNLGDAILTNATANVNVAYSGSLANSFEQTGNYTEFFTGGLNGFAADLGVNYQLKDDNSDGYKLNAGASLRNMGSMTFKDDNNVSRNYALNVPATHLLDLNQFSSAENLIDVENIIRSNDEYFTVRDTEKDFKVKLPAIFSLYADFKVYTSFYISAYNQQKLNDNSEDAQIAIQNIVTVTPRYALEIFEAYIPLSINEVSGFTAGAGLRVGGFFIGSGSILSAAISDTDQTDAYIGFRIGF